MEPGPLPLQDSSETEAESSSGAPDSLLAPAGRMRLVLRKLRDVDLREERVALDGDRSVLVSGCLSRDLPAERLLRYRLVSDSGEPQSLEMALTSQGLHLERRGAQRQLLHESELHLEGDLTGNLLSPELRYRIDPEEAGSREVEHFLRRLVRLAHS